MKLFNVSRLLLGLVFVVFGFDGVFHFMPVPPMPAPALEVVQTLKSYGLFYAVKALEVIAGLLLLQGRFTLLAASLLAPILFNIAWFDAALDPKSLPVALVLLALEGVVLWRFRPQLRPLVGVTQIQESQS